MLFFLPNQLNFKFSQRLQFKTFTDQFVNTSCISKRYQVVLTETKMLLSIDLLEFKLLLQNKVYVWQCNTICMWYMLSKNLICLNQIFKIGEKAKYILVN